MSFQMPSSKNTELCNNSNTLQWSGNRKAEQLIHEHQTTHPSLIRRSCVCQYAVPWAEVTKNTRGNVLQCDHGSDSEDSLPSLSAWKYFHTGLKRMMRCDRFPSCMNVPSDSAVVAVRLYPSPPLPIVHLFFLSPSLHIWVHAFSRQNALQVGSRTSGSPWRFSFLQREDTWAWGWMLEAGTCTHPDRILKLRSRDWRLPHACTFITHCSNMPRLLDQLAPAGLRLSPRDNLPQSVQPAYFHGRKPHQRSLGFSHMQYNKAGLD